jgi:acetylornithine deacetylase/succinyl-diaminopimelate desuccinylase-like protein
LELIDQCRKFIAIDSSPSGGSRDAAEFLRELCESLGLTVEFQEFTVQGEVSFNVIASLPGKELKPTLMLQGHLDTVEPGAYGLWASTGQNPFEAVVKDEKMFGLGISNGKADLLAKLYALSEYVGTPSMKSACLVATAGGTNGMGGAVQFVKRYRPKPQYALVGKPTGLSLLDSGRGIVDVEINIPLSDLEKRLRNEHDLSEDSSTQSKILTGQQPIGALFDYLEQLPNNILVLALDGGADSARPSNQAYLEFDMSEDVADGVISKVKKVKEVADSLKQEFAKYPEEKSGAVTTLHVSSIKLAGNDHVVIKGMCRLVAAVPNEVAEGWMDTLREVCGSLGAEFRMTAFKRPFLANRKTDFYQFVSEAVEEHSFERFCSEPTASEANIFQRFGIESVIFGPGKPVESGQVVDESIDLSDIEAAKDFYSSVLRRWLA